MRSLVLLLGILGVFGAALWHGRGPADGDPSGADPLARVTTVELADGPVFEAADAVPPQPAEAPEPEFEAPVEATEVAPPFAGEAGEVRSDASPPSSANESPEIVAAFDPDRSAGLVRRLLSVYARLGQADALEATP